MVAYISQKSVEINTKDYIYVTLRHSYCQIEKIVGKYSLNQALVLIFRHTNDINPKEVKTSR